MARLRWSWTSSSRIFTAALVFAISTSGAVLAQDDEESSPGEEDAPCFPECRTGYFCHKGECLSLCNPPCASDEACTADGECVAKDHGAPRLPVATELRPSEPQADFVTEPEKTPEPDDSREKSYKEPYEPMGIVGGLGGGASVCVSSVGCNTFTEGDFGADVHIIGGYRLLEWLVVEGGATYTHLFIAAQEDETGEKEERLDFLIAARAGARFFPLKRRNFIEPVLGIHTGYIFNYAKVASARNRTHGLNLDYVVGVDFKFTELFSVGVEAAIYEPIWLTTCLERESQTDDEGNEVFSAESECYAFDGKRDLFFFNFATQATLFF